MMPRANTLYYAHVNKVIIYGESPFVFVLAEKEETIVVRCFVVLSLCARYHWYNRYLGSWYSSRERNAEDEMKNPPRYNTIDCYDRLERESFQGYSCHPFPLPPYRISRNERTVAILLLKAIC